MTTYQQQAVGSERPSTWPIVSFFVLAYAIAWGAFATAVASGIACWATLKFAS